VLAATNPAVPARPYFLTFVNDELQIVVPRSNDNGGSPITYYELYVDMGDDYASDFTLLTTLDSSTSTYSAKVEDGLVRAKYYRFMTRAKNEIGLYSEYSRFAYIAFGNVPNALSAPIRLNSTETSVTL
jgi:hypothetical protein